MSASSPQVDSVEEFARGNSGNEALQWVSRELYATLSDAHEVLERYAEQPTEVALIERFASLLHAARGALQIAEIHGASLLVQEMEEVAGALARGQVGTVAEGLDALMRSIVQLPAYLDRIVSGGRDVPLILLPMFNDLRAVRGSPLLSESMLFVVNAAPDAIPWPRDQHGSGEDLDFVAARLHRHYQAALLGWLRGENVDGNLATMRVVAENVRDAATIQRLAQLWWAAGAIIEALMDGGLEAGSSVKRILGQTERMLGRLVEHGEEDFVVDTSDDVLSSMLYYVGRAGSSGTEVTAVREAFALDEVLPSRESIDLARADLGGPSTGLMETVAIAIKQDLSGVKDVLDIFVRSGRDDRTELGPQSGELKKIGDTLNVLGLPHLGETVDAQRRALEQLVVGQDEDSIGDALLAIAAELLCVEDRLDEDLVALVSSVDEHPNPDAGSAREREFAKVVEATLRECNANLGKVKEIISTYAQEPADKRDLDKLEGLLGGVAAGLLMLEHERALGVTERLAVQIRAMMVNASELPSPLELDCLADALVSLEYYIETLGRGRSDPSYMLDNAEACLGNLTRSEQPEATALPPAEPEPDDASASGTWRGLQPFVADSRDHIDPELLELFIEESKEEIESMAACFPAWKEQPDSRELLLSVRRSFHTLKGSGRMVGAQVIGEFAWSVESLLNRLINRSLPHTEQLAAFIGESIEALSHLVEQLEVGTQPPFRIEDMIDRAAALADGERGAVSSASARLDLPRDEAAPEAGEVEPDATAGGQQADSPALKLVDTGGTDSSGEPTADPTERIPVPSEQAGAFEAAAQGADGATPETEAAQADALFAVYAEETRGHLETVRRYVGESRSCSEPYPLPAELHRAWHTLNGSARSAGVEHVAAVTGPMYEYIDEAYSDGGSLPEKAIITMAQVANLIDQTLLALGAPDGVQPSLAPTLASIEALMAERDATVHTEAEPDETAVPEDAEAAPSRPEAVDSAAAADADVAAADAADAEEADEVAADADVAAPDAEEAVADADDVDATEDIAAVEYDEAIAQIFAEEATELLNRADAVLQGWAQEPRNSQEAVTELKRVLHTLKGGARMAGLAEMGDVSHELESLLSDVQQSQAAADQGTVETVQFILDSLHRNSDRLAAGKPLLSMGSALRRLSLTPAGAEETPEAPQPVVEPPSPAPEAPPVSAKIGVPADELAAASSAALWQDAGSAERTEMARVDAEALDNMLNHAGEISIFRSRLEQQLSQLGFNAAEFAQTVSRLRDQLRKLELETEAQILYGHMEEGQPREAFDPLEMDRYSNIQQLSRALAESVSDLGSIQETVEDLTNESEALLVQQSRVTAELQDGLMRTRMVPFAEYAQRLSRIVRQTAGDVGKRAELRIEGGSGEMDRQVLERILPPLEHMLRNAVVHGTETPEERRLLGKDENATILLRLRREGSEMVISVEDDGAGLDVAAIRRKAVAHGLVGSDESLTDNEAMRLILRAGFSTAPQVTQAAGRGVGMDVVATEVRKLGGTLGIESRTGVGAHFSVRLPFTMAIMQALLVRTNESRYAIPLPSVEGIVRIAADELRRYLEEDAPTFVYGGQGYRFRHLGVLLGGEPTRAENLVASTPVILVRAGEHSTALVVDEMMGSREIVVKNAGPQIASVRGVSGATILGDGDIVLILDVSSLVRGGPLPKIRADDEEPAAEESGPLALVVDDSITVRRVTTRLLERSGFRVMTAKDGIDAIAIMQDVLPDIMLLDIEMPRMDGYEVVGHVRNDSRLRELPIVMVTSRVGDKHRAHGLALGVDQYLGKPYQESQLLAAIEPLLARKKKHR